MALLPDWNGVVAFTPPGAYNQTTYPGNGGTIDDCAPVSANQCARAVGGQPVTITTFRNKINVPKGGLTRDEVLTAARACWPELGIILAPSSDWGSFKTHLQNGYICSVMVVSGKLPETFGFIGLHQVSIRIVAGVWYIVNPLQPEGSKAVPITESALRAAILATGAIRGVLFSPAHVDTPPITGGGNIPVPPPVPTIDPASANYKAGYTAGVAAGTLAGTATGTAAGRASMKQDAILAVQNVK